MPNGSPEPSSCWRPPTCQSSLSLPRQGLLRPYRCANSSLCSWVPRLLTIDAISTARRVHRTLPKAIHRSTELTADAYSWLVKIPEQDQDVPSHGGSA